MRGRILKPIPPHKVHRLKVRALAETEEWGSGSIHARRAWARYFKALEEWEHKEIFKNSEIVLDSTHVSCYNYL